jgi:hypothetical protein
LNSSQIFGLTPLKQDSNWKREFEKMKKKSKVHMRQTSVCIGPKLKSQSTKMMTNQKVLSENNFFENSIDGTPV